MWLFQCVRLSLFNLLMIKVHSPEQILKADFIVDRIGFGLVLFFQKARASYHTLSSKESVKGSSGNKGN